MYAYVLVLGSRIKKIVPVEKIKKLVLEKHVPTQKYKLDLLFLLCIYLTWIICQRLCLYVYKDFEILAFIKNHFFKIQIFEIQLFSQLFNAFYS